MTRTAEQIVDENLSGLAEVIQDVDVLVFYRDLIIELMNEHSKLTIQDVIKEYHATNVNMIRHGGKHKSIDQVAVDYMKAKFPIK